MPTEPPDTPDDEATAQLGSADDAPTRMASDSAGVPTPAERQGTQLGPYKLIQLIGEGGFGRVWEAEQKSPVRRRVALKIVKLGLETERVIARFEAERQALAVMDHPGIAKVFDAGVTETGRPYFVMELVRGSAITKYCDARRLEPKARLELFVDVCRAVQHAHQKGILHRDLKPSNVLVTEHDDRPQAKVIDFGIAKAMSGSLTDRTIVTAMHQFLGTPEYMSPEQAATSNLDVDTRSDVYSLGVMLYELLTGVTPFEFRKAAQLPYGEIQRILQEEEPTTPSSRITSLGDDSEEITRARKLDLQAMRQQLRGDLDWIVMKALEKDRTRRYETANALAMDIERHLNDEPVVAGPASLSYRMSKWIRRHRVTFAAGLAVTLALVLGMVGTTWGLLRAADQAREAESQRAVAEAVNQFLNEDLLQAVVPSAQQGRGRDVTMREVLDTAAGRIEEESAAGGRFADSPEVEMNIRVSLGFAYERLAEYAAAEPHTRKAHELAKLAFGERSPESAWTLEKLSSLRLRQGHYDEAIDLARQSVEIAREALGPTHENTLRYEGSLALALRWAGRYREAEEVIRESLPRLEETLGPEHDNTLIQQSNLANILQETGRYEEARAIREPQLEISRRHKGPKDPFTLAILNNLANDIALSGDLATAEPLLREALQLKAEIYGPEHPSTVNSLSGVAETSYRLGRRDEAIELCRQVLSARLGAVGEQHSRSIGARERLAAALLLPPGGVDEDPFEKTPLPTADLEEARGLIEDASRTCQASLGAEHPACVQTAATLADALTASDLPERAVAILERTLQLIASQREAGEDVGAYEETEPWLEFELGEALALTGELDRALPLMARAAEKLPVGEVPSRNAFTRLAGWLEEGHRASPEAGYGADAEHWRQLAER